MTELDKQTLPLFVDHISCGFASAIDGYLDTPLNLNEHLIKNPSSTFFLRSKGDSMVGVGIFPGDILVVDRSLSPQDKDAVVAVVNGEFIAKLLSLKNQALMPANKEYTPIPFNQADVTVWGVITYAIHIPKGK